MSRRRRRLKLTQAELAELAGVEPGKIKDLETRLRKVSIPGDRSSPRSWVEFAAICRELDEDPVELLRRKGLM